jgi:hexosaminidase
MIDPARHFLSVAEVNKTIDGMAQNKLNALHMHLTDGESFTVNTDGWAKFPLLSAKGAYAPQLSYTKADFTAIVAHGRLRGVRVIPEFDLPAHMASWAQGYEELITDCPTVNPYPMWPRYYSPADVTNERLYQCIEEILVELGSVFTDAFWHVGGDEPHFDCWDANANVSKYKKEHDLDNYGLYAMFEGRYAALLTKHGKQVIGWQEIFSTKGTSPDKNTTVVEVWEGNAELASVVEAGFSGIVSSNWYLNNGGDWTKYYTDDPMSYLPKDATPAMRARVLGGESCMWNSAFDANSNMEPAIWPNAAAMAEQLWSPQTESIDKARTRLSQHRCRMVRRGVRASPIAEDYCGQDLYVRKSRSFAFPGDFPVSPETPRP